MGGINVISALGQPLKAEIDLVAVEKADKSSITARLASLEAFKGAGVDYPSGLPKIKFQVDTRANGETYLKLTTTQPLNEPFVSLLIELGWASGKLLREYTFLLDPPEFKAEQPKVAEVKPVEPSVATAAPVPAKVEAVKTESVEVVRNDPQPIRAVAPVDKKALAAVEQKAAVSSSNVAAGSITIKRGDTLSKLAAQVKSDVSLERMLVALYRVNGDAFDGNNMNRLRVGKILRMPDQSELDKVAQVDALKELHAQVADWHTYRQSLAAAGGVASEKAAKQEVSGKISTAVADKAPVVKETAKEVVKLSKGEIPSDKVATAGGAKAAQVVAKQDDAVAKAKAEQDAKQRAAVLEKNVQDMKRLAELKTQAAAAKPVEAKPAEVKPVEVAKPAAKVEAKPAVKASKPVNVPMVLTPPPSVLGDIVAYGFGGAAGIVGLGWLMYFGAQRRRQKMAGAEDTESLASSTGHIAAPVVPSPETGDFTHTVPPVASVASTMDDVDPISEAELFLNFGRDVQAEEILKDALIHTPNNHQIHLKLLSIYANRKDAAAFASIALQLKALDDEAAWQHAQDMGRKLDPTNSLYGGEGHAAPVAETATAEEAQHEPASLDFDLGFSTPATSNESTVILDAPLAAPSVMDFDLGSDAAGYQNTVVLGSPISEEQVDALDITTDLQDKQTIRFDSTADLNSIFDKTRDLDTTSPTPEPEAASPADLAEMLFDVTASRPAEAEPTPAAGEDTGLDFALDFPVSEPVVAAVAEPVPSVFGDITLNLDNDKPSDKSAPMLELSSEKWQEVATKLDLAKAYQEMGDGEGAQEILQEVLREGDEEQRAVAQTMLQQLSA